MARPNKTSPKAPNVVVGQLTSGSCATQGSRPNNSRPLESGISIKIPIPNYWVPVFSTHEGDSRTNFTSQRVFKLDSFIPK